jgi:hypothetical protein
MTFAAFERRWIDAILPSFLPEDGALTVAADAVDYGAASDVMATHATRLASLGLRAAVWLAALAPVWMLGRAQTIDELSRPDRTVLLDRMLAHRAYAIRGPATLLKLNAVLALLQSREVRARTHYDRPAPSRRSLPLHAEG